MKKITLIILLLILIPTIYAKEGSMKLLAVSENNNKLKLSRPWVNLYDNNGNILNVALLSRPFFQSNDEEDYKNKIVGKFNVLGISSYQEFPNQPYNPADGYNKTTPKQNKSQ